MGIKSKITGAGRINPAAKQFHQQSATIHAGTNRLSGDQPADNRRITGGCGEGGVAAPLMPSSGE